MSLSNRLSWCVVTTLVAVSTGCSGPDTSPCAPDGGGVAVSGEFREGKGVAPGGAPPVFPFKTSAVVHSEYRIDRVTIGGTPATLGTDRQWVANQYPADLERNRDGGTATLAIRATDLCGVEHELDDLAIVPIGPAPGQLVSDLRLTAELIPPTECSVPASGRVQPLIRVTASPESVGSEVKLTANQGTFASGTATENLTLRSGSGRSEQVSFFTPPGKDGYAVINASANGVSAQPAVILVVGPPQISGPSSPLIRGLAYTATVRSSGNLATCFVDESVRAAASLTFVDPPLGAYDGGVVNVARAPVSCDGPEFVRVEVMFPANAPDGGSLTLRCFDSFAQEAVRSFVVSDG